MSRLVTALMTVFTSAVANTASAEAPPGWTAVGGGQWQQVIDLQPVLVQRSREGVANVVSNTIRGTHGAWRCWVQPSVGTETCGIWLQASRDLTSGFKCELGGNAGVGGLTLQDAKGNVLWRDHWAPWEPYEAIVLEGIVEKGRIRLQMLRYDGHTLISQSDWVAVPETETEREGYLGVYTENGTARFWNAARVETPLSPLTDDAPNKRRLVQGTADDWSLFGTGDWMWTDATRTRVRQYAQTERAWALDPGVHGRDRIWRCNVRVDPGAGGAGLVFKLDEHCEGGFNCWLGGTYGAGGLMLYRNGGPGKVGEALWSSPQDKWHYNEDLVLEAETKGNEVRVTLLQGDGETVIVQSPWKELTPEETDRDGYLAFHTWKGSAEFWGFSGESQTSATQAAAALPKADPALGADWLTKGDGKWAWGDDDHTRFRQTAKPTSASCLNTTLTGTKGTWRCVVNAPDGTSAAGLLFQVSKELTEGFALLLTRDGVRLTDLAQNGAVLWESPGAKLLPNKSLVLEGLVQTDRLVARVLTADGKTVIVQSPPVYVSDRNNGRDGCLGLRTEEGAAEFSSWSLADDE